jgi:hypothetical protein
VDDAIARGFLPSFSLDKPCTLDLRSMHPVLAEAYASRVIVSLRSRAEAASKARTGAGATSPPSRLMTLHDVTLLVPPFELTDAEPWTREGPPPVGMPTGLLRLGLLKPQAKTEITG